MQWVLGLLIVAVGMAMLIAGAEGNGAGLFTSITGKTLPASSAANEPQTASAILTALNYPSAAPVNSSGFAASVTAQGGGQPVAT